MAESVVLRAWERHDWRALEAALSASKNELADWLPALLNGLGDADRLEIWLTAAQALFEAGDSFVYAIVENGDVVGQCSLDRHPDASGEVGYWVRSDRTGRGLATAAVRALTAAAFDFGFERLEIRCDAGNLRSASVARRAGFEHVGTVELATREGTPAQTGIELVWVLQRQEPGSSHTTR